MSIIHICGIHCEFQCMYLFYSDQLRIFKFWIISKLIICLWWTHSNFFFLSCFDLYYTVLLTIIYITLPCNNILEFIDMIYLCLWTFNQFLPVCHLLFSLVSVNHYFTSMTSCFKKSIHEENHVIFGFLCLAYFN
jgi:hypothetical protein